MYGYEWTDEYGIFRLTVNAKLQKEIRPVFKEELDFFKMYEHWDYPDTDAPCFGQRVYGAMYSMVNALRKQKEAAFIPALPWSVTRINVCSYSRWILIDCMRLTRI